MLRPQKMTRFVGPNGKNRKVEWSEHISNLFEHIGVSRVSRVEDLLVERSLNDETTP
jgi:hypothetical protein